MGPCSTAVWNVPRKAAVIEQANRAATSPQFPPPREVNDVCSAARSTNRTLRRTAGYSRVAQPTGDLRALSRRAGTPIPASLGPREPRSAILTRRGAQTPAGAQKTDIRSNEHSERAILNPEATGQCHELLQHLRNTGWAGTLLHLVRVVIAAVRSFCRTHRDH